VTPTKTHDRPASTMHHSENTENQALGPADQGAIYEILSRLLCAEVDERLLSYLRNPALMELFRQADPEVEHLLCTAQSVEIEAMGHEYLRLFVYAEGVPPYASSWGGGAFEGQEFVTRCMDRLGFDDDHGLRGLPRDHLGLLLALSGQALCSGDSQLVAMGRALESDYLGRWMLQFADALHRSSTNPLYRALGVLLSLSHPLAIQPE
jgi:TorA maturation chaperone TorD